MIILKEVPHELATDLNRLGKAIFTLLTEVCSVTMLAAAAGLGSQVVLANLKWAGISSSA